jgi:starch-binding outer membrane protein, SusD/RagB family
MKKFIIYISTFSLLTLAGCDNYLDTIPDNRTDINTPEKISEVLVNAYPRGNYSAFCELMSDNVSDNIQNATPDIVYSKPYFWEDVLQLNEDTPQFYWASCYAAIAAANEALESIKALGDTPNLNPQKGEALVARAYAHLMLVSLFSKFYDPTTAKTDLGIPYVTETEKVVIKKYNRGTVESVYKMIEDDLTKGIPLIRDDVYKVGAYHFTRNAANALASRFYLYKRDYDNVIKYASNVAGTIGFAANMRNWNTNLTNKSYTIISTEYSLATEKSNLLLTETASVWSRYFAGNRYALSLQVKNYLFDNPNPSGGLWAYDVYGGTPEFLNLPKYNELFVRLNPSSNIGNVYLMMPALTTEEVLFNRAEAYLYKNDYTNCLADLNTFLSLRILNYVPATHNLTVAKNNAFYGTTNTIAAIRQTLLDCRRREFIHEGMRWFDILRYNIPVTHNVIGKTSITLAADDKRRALQLPQEASLSGLPLNPR